MLKHKLTIPLATCVLQRSLWVLNQALLANELPTLGVMESA
jgi:hypothetical protein